MGLPLDQESSGTPPWGASRVALLLSYCLLALYAFGILSIGLTRDWHLFHEDNGAMHTTLALSHLKLGLERTRAHDLFFNPKTGEVSVYGHHPPATALVLAGAFLLTGSDSPAVARMVAIAFHLASLFLLVRLLSRFFAKGTVLLGGFVMATLPMSSYFGRMVNYEPLCLFAVLLQLDGYAAFKYDRAGRGLARLALGVLLGGLIDWASFFFAAAIAVAEVADALRRRSRSLLPLVVVVISAVGTFLFDLWHLWYAGHESLTPFREVLTQNQPLWEQKFSLGKFFSRQIEIFRRYYTHAGLLSSLLVAFGLAASRTRLSKSLFNVPEGKLVKRLLAVTGGAGLGYILAAPYWARVHPYWQFYFLPFVVLSMLLVWHLLWQKVTENQTAFFRGLLAILILEALITSAYTLHARHTKIGAYALKQTAKFRATYLAPASLEEKEFEGIGKH
jgi:hypothetical protein